MFIQKKKKFTAALEFMACIKYADVEIVLISLHSNTYDILKFTLRKACTQFSLIKLKNFETKKNLIYNSKYYLY